MGLAFRRDVIGKKISILEGKSMKDLIIEAVKKEIDKWEKTKSKTILTVFQK